MELFSNVDIDRDFPDHGKNGQIPWLTTIVLTNEPEVKLILSSPEQPTRYHHGDYEVHSTFAYQAQEDYINHDTICATPGSSASGSSTSPNHQN